MCLQVENVDMRFKKLEELRLCGWVEDKPVEVKKKVVRPNAIAKKAAKPTGGPSRLREMIAGKGSRNCRKTTFLCRMIPIVQSLYCSMKHS